MTILNKIWCLFSVSNDYDQPDHNLVCWWADKPSIDAVSKIVCGKQLTELTDESILVVVGIVRGDKCDFDGCEYRLEEVAMGKPMPVRK